MPKVVWKEFLKRTFKHKRSGAKRKMLFEIRSRAQQCMIDLTFIVKNMKNVSEKPAHQFAKIFTDDVYLSMFDAVTNARRASLLCKQNMVNPELIPALFFALHSAQIKYDPAKLYIRSYRLDMAEKLKEKEFAEGKHYWKNAYSYIQKVRSGFFKHTVPNERELG